MRLSNSKHWFTTSFLQPLPYLVTSQVPENCQLTSSFFVVVQTVISFLQTTQILSDVCFITDHVLTPAQMKPKSFESRRNSFSSFLPGVDAPRVYVRAWALGCIHSLISTETFRTALTGDKEYPFSGVTKSGRVWRKVPESGARSVCVCLTEGRVI